MDAREDKNRHIAETIKHTYEKRAEQICRVFTVKVQDNKLSKRQREQLKMMFVEAKWLKNSILAWSNNNPDNKIWDYDTKQNVITHKDKDMHDVEVELKYIPASVKQCVQSEMIANIRTISSLNKKGLQKGGKLKFVSEVKSLNFKQYGKTHRIVSSKRIKLQGVSGTVTVNGMNQFYGTDVEYANAKLLNTPLGYYVQFTTYQAKSSIVKKEDNGKVIGIDFGCSTAFTTSEGEKIPASIQESERIKRLSAKMNRRQIKGSKNWYRTVGQIRKEYQKMTNRKNDLANKITAYFNEYKTIVIQDEQLSNWMKGNHGKAVQHSVMGRVKAKLMLNPKTIVLSKTVPTTKLCTSCGQYHDDMKVWDRTFTCGCGVNMDRDVHAALDMVWFYEHNVGVGHTNFKRAEMEALVLSALSTGNQLASVKHEADCL
jgi:putative transposase